MGDSIVEQLDLDPKRIELLWDELERITRVGKNTEEMVRLMVSTLEGYSSREVAFLLVDFAEQMRRLWQREELMVRLFSEEDDAADCAVEGLLKLFHHFNKLREGGCSHKHECEADLEDEEPGEEGLGV